MRSSRLSRACTSGSRSETAKRITCAELLGALESLLPGDFLLRAPHAGTAHFADRSTCALGALRSEEGEWDCAGNPACRAWSPSFVPPPLLNPPHRPRGYRSCALPRRLSRGSQLEKLRKLNEFVIANRARRFLKVPYRTGARIFGDEKRRSRAFCAPASCGAGGTFPHWRGSPNIRLRARISRTSQGRCSSLRTCTPGIRCSTGTSMHAGTARSPTAWGWQ